MTLLSQVAGILTSREQLDLVQTDTLSRHQPGNNIDNCYTGVRKHRLLILKHFIKLDLACLTLHCKLSSCRPRIICSKPKESWDFKKSIRKRMLWNHFAQWIRLWILYTVIKSISPRFASGAGSAACSCGPMAEPSQLDSMWSILTPMSFHLIPTMPFAFRQNNPLSLSGVKHLFTESQPPPSSLLPLLSPRLCPPLEFLGGQYARWARGGAWKFGSECTDDCCLFWSNNWYTITLFENVILSFLVLLSVINKARTACASMPLKKKIQIALRTWGSKWHSMRRDC